MYNQLIDGSNRCDTFLDPLLSKKEDPTTDMNTESTLGGEIREFKILEEVRKINSRTTTLNSTRAEFSLLWEIQLVW